MCGSVLAWRGGEVDVDGVADLRGAEVGALSGEDRCGEQHGKVMRPAGFLAGEIGALVLSQDGLSVDGNERLGCELVVAAAVDETVFPVVVA